MDSSGEKRKLSILFVLKNFSTGLKKNGFSFSPGFSVQSSDRGDRGRWLFGQALAQRILQLSALANELRELMTLAAPRRMHFLIFGQ